MTGMLASVCNIDEVQLILQTSVDIIDLKNPKQGALGALPVELVTEIVQLINKQKPVSATVGDLPMQAELVFNAVSAMANTGVDYIKIGFFPEGDWQATLDKLSQITEQGQQLIAVLFADTKLDFNIIQSIKAAGFSGVMIDTIDKSKGSLLDIMSTSTIEKFVTASKSAELLCGLAGSLKQTDIASLLPLNADYLGFRGALCQQHNRTTQIDKQAVDTIQNSFL